MSIGPWKFVGETRSFDPSQPRFFKGTLDFLHRISLETQLAPSKEDMYLPDGLLLERNLTLSTRRIENRS